MFTISIRLSSPARLARCLILPDARGHAAGGQWTMDSKRRGQWTIDGKKHGEEISAFVSIVKAGPGFRVVRGVHDAGAA
jgi:hypothetical protein